MPKFKNPTKGQSKSFLAKPSKAKAKRKKQMEHFGESPKPKSIKILLRNLFK